VRATTFSSSPHLKCDFFYPEKSLLKDPTHAYPYLHQLNEHHYSSQKALPSFSFGKQLSRDQASDIKDVLQILNERKLQKEREKQRRLQSQTLGQMAYEEEIKR
jgi:hypothetical protein